MSKDRVGDAIFATFFGLMILSVIVGISIAGREQGFSDGYCAALGGERLKQYTCNVGGRVIPISDDAPPPCASDDGSGPIPCRWDASIQGNGEGTSFTVLAPGVFAYEEGS